MKIISRTDKDIMKVFVTITMVIVFCILAWCFLNNQTNQLKKGYINGIAKDNEYFVNVIANRIESSASNEAEATEILKSLPPAGTRYWFLLSSEELIFERDTDTTSDLVGMSYSNLEDYYIREGGSGESKFFELIRKGEDFSVVMIKDRDYGSEIISVQFIEIGGEKLCVGTSVLQSYMFSISKIVERIYFLRIMTLISCFITIVLTAYYSARNRKKEIEIRNLMKELKEKNLLVEEQGERLVDEADDPDKSDDNLTGLYNRNFFDALVTKLSERNAEKIGIIYIKILNLKKLNYEEGFTFANQLLITTAKLFEMHSTDKDICSRISKNEFAMIKIDTTDEVTLQTSMELYTALKKTNPKGNYEVGSSYKKENKTLVDTIEIARKHRKSKERI